METDLGQTFTTNIYGAGGDEAAGAPMAGMNPDTASTDGMPAADDVKGLFKSFLSHFSVGYDYIYTSMLRSNLRVQMHFIEVNIEHLQQFSEHLGQMAITQPTRALPKFEAAASELAEELKLFDMFVVRKEVQIQLFWATTPINIRQLAQAAVAKLVCTSGIVIKANSSSAKCTKATIQCTSCRTKAVIAGGKSIDMPPQCMNNGGAAGGAGGAGGGGGVGRQKCRPNPYVMLPQECLYEDQQVLKLQELPEDVPTGELPRHINAVVDRYLVDKISPGTRVHIVGIVSVQDRKSSEKTKGGSSRGTVGLRAQYIRCVGIMVMGGKANDGATSVISINKNYSSKIRSRTATGWQAEDEASFKRFAKERHIYETIAECIDPAVFGLKDQKKSIACLLFGGTRKKQENNYLRGDMNVLFIGDPSTAKSQLLKFTEKVAPISVYTSGKGSSAAGLTASVVGSGGGEFWLEAGAMVLADGGVVCIDEFDKMRDQDQVAIHEAMEQQTISIAKANLTTMLNSRTSVLAAANPTMGSYNPLQSNEEQMDFQGSILTRFDLIFKVLDPKDPTIDRRLAQHVVKLHKGNTSTSATVQSPVPLPFLTKYIAYAKNTCRPQISEEAMTTLLDFFVQVRKDAHALHMSSMAGSKDGKGGSAPLIQITARQLESMVRITESLAKMRLDALATVEDAEEAIRLFKVATVDAINSGVSENTMTEEQTEAVMKIEEAIRRRVAVGATVQHSRLAAEMSRMGFDGKLVDRAFYTMMRREELEWRKQRTLIFRSK